MIFWSTCIPDRNVKPLPLKSRLAYDNIAAASPFCSSRWRNFRMVDISRMLSSRISMRFNAQSSRLQREFNQLSNNSGHTSFAGSRPPASCQSASGGFRPSIVLSDSEERSDKKITHVAQKRASPLSLYPIASLSSTMHREDRKYQAALASAKLLTACRSLLKQAKARSSYEVTSRRRRGRKCTVSRA